MVYITDQTLRKTVNEHYSTDASQTVFISENQIVCSYVATNKASLVV